ncbi:MAG: hypothetical protein EXR92_00785 [Gemmatimonadetes bacterium]|nr:hypothetical protein [Gemmatimonadota bacterium]
MKIRFAARWGAFTPSRSASILTLAAAVGLGGCGDERTPQAEFENLTIQVEALGGREVQLEDRQALLLDELHLTGVLDSTDPPVTTGILYTIRDGVETRTELVVAWEMDGEMTYLASHPLGNRMRIEGIRYQEGQIVVDLLEF